MNNEYDISKAFERIEETLIKSMSSNLGRHLREENKEGMNWSAWQAEQLKSLEAYKKKYKNKFNNVFSSINTNIEDILRKSRDDGRLEQEKIILEAIKNGNFKSNDKKINKLWNIYRNTKKPRIKKKQLNRIYDIVNQSESSFFKVDENKLNNLINETKNNLRKAETSILRYTDDKYKKIIFDSQVYANTGSGTPEQAIDMATHDFLQAGINNIEYSNGARVNIKSYVEMAIRTANSRAHMYGEGEKRDRWGVHTVLVPNRGGGCPFCIKFQGRVFIDDVWSSGTEAESNSTGYPLLSSAMKERLFHPNCKDTTVTYFPGINSEAIPPTKKEIAEKKNRYEEESKLNYIDRNIEKYKRLELGSLDNENVEKYHNKRLQWEEYKKKYQNNHKLLFNGMTKPEKNGIMLSDIEKNQITEYTRFDATKINSAIRTGNITSGIQSKIDIIDDAINKATPLQEDIVLHRGTIMQSFSGFEKMNKISHDEIMDLKEKVISDRAFISTSKEKAEEQGRNIIMNINVPKGFKGALDIEEYATPKYKYQKEVLLKRNTKFYVKDIKFNEKNKKYYFEVEVLDE